MLPRLADGYGGNFEFVLLHPKEITFLLITMGYVLIYPPPSPLSLPTNDTHTYSPVISPALYLDDYKPSQPCYE